MKFDSDGEGLENPTLRLALSRSCIQSDEKYVPSFLKTRDQDDAHSCLGYAPQGNATKLAARSKTIWPASVITNFRVVRSRSLASKCCSSLVMALLTVDFGRFNSSAHLVKLSSRQLVTKIESVLKSIVSKLRTITFNYPYCFNINLIIVWHLILSHQVTVI